MSLNIEWARRCAKDFADKPTEARARNAAQCLAGLLDAYDDIRTQFADAAEAYRVLRERDRLVREMGAKLDMPPEIAANPEAYTAPCTAAGWHRPGIDPCPARSHQNETCLKGYLHTGGHEWGGTKTIIAGPDLSTLVDGSADPDQRSHNCRCAVGIEPAGPELCRYPGCENPENGMGHFHATDRSGQI
jgi:hypothetical protein